jgi:hypothetical protein
VEVTVKRTSIWLTEKQFVGLAQAAKADPAGRKPAHLIRAAIADYRAQLKKQQAQAK